MKKMKNDIFDLKKDHAYILDVEQSRCLPRQDRDDIDVCKKRREGIE